MKYWRNMVTMKKGRISKEEENLIKDNIHLGLDRIATELDRDPDSVLCYLYCV